ncbi:MAG: hypothetical protein COA69_13590 [Robiginitomaculum sp.]|nr:MAG: hypothetical protein COA69_13590 [Robiginitomaculum sp.]
MAPSSTESNNFIDHMSDKLIESGKPIAGGWLLFVKVADLDEHSKAQRKEMHQAYFTGAQHTFAMMMHGLSDGEEITETDLKRMDNIANELAEFAAEMKIKGA